MLARSLKVLLSGKAFAAGAPFFMQKRPVFRLLSENSFLGFFLPSCSLPLGWHLLLGLASVGWVVVAGILGLSAVGAWAKPPPVASAKNLLAKVGTSLGMELSLTCYCILEKNLEANFTEVETILVSNFSSPTSTLLVLIEFWEKDARCIQNWWVFPMKNICKSEIQSELSHIQFLVFLFLMKRMILQCPPECWSLQIERRTCLRRSWGPPPWCSHNQLLWSLKRFCSCPFRQSANWFCYAPHPSWWQLPWWASCFLVERIKKDLCLSTCTTIRSWDPSFGNLRSNAPWWIWGRRQWEISACSRGLWGSHCPCLWVQSEKWWQTDCSAGWLGWRRTLWGGFKSLVRS